MANLTPEEFAQIVRCLADDLGLQRMRDTLVRRNALVMRRRAASADALANQLYQLTGGLRRPVVASLVLQTMWTERMNERLGEDGEKELEELAEKINACLGEHDDVDSAKETELDALLVQYEQRLAAKVGAERARIDMLMKAVPAVAVKLRGMPLSTGQPAAEPAAPELPEGGR
jgi:hypothetical protein